MLSRLRQRRLLILSVLGLLLIASASAYIQFWLARPIGSGPAGPAVANEAFKKTWTDRPVLLLGIGDSITAGLGSEKKSHGFFERLAKNPDDEWSDMDGRSLGAVLPQLELMNLAISGSTSLQHEQIIEKLEPRDDVLGLVVMTTGGNDLIHNYGRTAPREGAMYGATLAEAQPWIDNFEARLNRMLDHLDEKFSAGCLIYLADIYDPTDGVGDAPSVFLPDWPDGLAIHAEYNRVLHQVCEERKNVFLVPLHATFMGHGSHCRQFWRACYRSDDPHYWFWQNIEDPNDRGHDAIRRAFLNAIVESEWWNRNSL
jgi:lysophospholipase L1-like esterase